MKNTTKSILTFLMFLTSGSAHSSEQLAYTEEELRAFQAMENNVAPLDNTLSQLTTNVQNKSEAFRDFAQAQNTKIENILKQNDKSSVFNGGSNAPKPMSNIVLFTSLTLPDATLRQQLIQSRELGIPLVIRGVLPQGFEATTQRISELLGVVHGDGENPPTYKIDGGFAISPDWFKRLDVQAIPALAVISPGTCDGLNPCHADNFDIVYGNVSLGEALEVLASGDRGSLIKRHLAMRGQQ